MKNSQHHMLDLLILVSIVVGNFCQGLVVFYHDSNCFLQFWTETGFCQFLSLQQRQSFFPVS